MKKQLLLSVGLLFGICNAVTAFSAVFAGVETGSKKAVLKADSLSAPGPSDTNKVNTRPVSFGPRPTSADMGVYGNNGSNWVDFSRLRNKAKDIFKFGGYYRFLGFYRNMVDPLGGSNYPKTIGVGDGYREPLMNLSVNATPTAGVALGTDLYFMPGYTGPTTTEGNLSLYLGINVYSSIKTKLGTLNIRAGGIHWYHLSPFTFWQNRGYNRFSTFERNPWEPVVGAGDRYNRYWERESLRQDVRWDNQAFQGIIVEALKLPYDFNAFLLLGKTQNNGGGIAYSTGKIPNSSVGGRLEKVLGSQLISFNNFTSTTYLDSINIDEKHLNRFSINSVEGSFLYKGIRIGSEIGLGSFKTPAYSSQYGVAEMLRVQIPRDITYVPVDVHVYSIDKNFVNVNSTFINTSKPQVSSTLLPFSSPVVDIGSMTNNRQGVNLNTEVPLGPLVLNIGLGASQEIDKLNRQISYYHRINAVSWSRFNFYQSGIGPYGRLNSLFRQVTEVVNINGNGDLPAKHFNNLDLHFKFKEKIAGHDFYLFWLSTTASVSSQTTPVPVITSDAWMRLYYNEFDLNYVATKKLVLIGYYGLERAIGNKDTDIDKVTGKPRDQIGQGWGLGADIHISEQAGLYLRQRWYKYEDRNFSLDHFKGHESTVELKIFF